MLPSLRHIVPMLCFLGVTSTALLAGDRGPNDARQGSPWTLDEALQQCALYPHDAYLQYVALQLARRDGRQGATACQPTVPGPDATHDATVSRRPPRTDRPVQPHHRGSGRAGKPAARCDDRGGRKAVNANRDPAPPAAVGGNDEPADIDISRLTGPTVRSHPFEEMLAGRKPSAVASGGGGAGKFLLRPIPFAGQIARVGGQLQSVGHAPLQPIDPGRF